MPMVFGKGLPALGEAYEGGYFAGQINDGGVIYNLVVSPKASGETAKAWKTVNTSTAGTTSLTNGLSNSNAMNNAAHPAAQFCRALTIGGFTDWYMPAQDELEILYFNLKPESTENNTGSGINTNAVPPRSGTYTSGNPGQTTASLFKTGGSEAIEGAPFAMYFSSTQSATVTSARRQYFTNGGQDQAGKANSLGVRAIRRVAA